MRDDEFEAYAAADFVSNSFMHAVAGVKSCNSTADFRTWWEVPQEELGSVADWQLLHNGSPYCPFHYPAFFAVRSDKGMWTQLMANGGARPGENYYPAEGIAYGKRTDTMYGYIKPRGQIFSQEGQSLFPRLGVSIWGALALANSCIYSLHANYVAGQHKYHNYLNKICLPTREIPTDSIRAKEAHELLRAIDLANENTHLFVCPKHRPEFQLERSADHRATVAERLLSAVDELRAEIDRILQNSLHFQNREGLNRRVDYYSHYFGDSFSPHLVGSTWVTYALGTAFGRWDIRFATGEKTAPELPDPFAPLPICPPGQLQNEQGLPITREDVIRLKEEGRWNYPLEIPWDGILVDDPGHPLDIEARVHQVLQIIWQDRWEAIEREACELLGVHTLRDYFRKPAGFFADHLKRYSKSRRKAPIYWPLQTPSGSYTLWLYYHRLNDQTLYTCVNDFVEKAKLREVTEQLDVLRTKASRSKQEENDLERLLDLEQELKNFRDELLRVAQFWKPNLNDGVQITAAPLWKLFQHKPWQNTLKDTWEKLEKRDYDWAHLAYSIWPDRVRDKCRHDKSLAIAHGLEDLYEAPPDQPKKKRGRTRG